MQGLILAAGMGTRLGKCTEDIPKVMMEIQGKSLIMYALQRLYEQNVSETIIVVGYKKEYILEKCGDHYNEMKLTYVINDRYESTNNVYSFYLATKKIHDDLLMVEGDLIFSKELLDSAVLGKHDCNIVVSKYNRNTMNGTVIKAQNNIARELITKKFQGEGFDYESAWKTVNIYYFSRKFMEKFSRMLKLYVEIGNLNNYYELVLGALIYFGDDDIRTVVVDENDWFEIDDEKDFLIASEHGAF